MASLAMEIGDGDDYVQLCPVEEDGDGDDYLQLSPAEEDGDGEDYLQLSPVEEDGADHHQLPPEQDDEEEDEDGGRVFSSELLGELRLSSLADIIPRVGIPCAPDYSDVALAVAEVLKTVEAPSDESRDCPICLQEDDDTAAWKETPCGHRFHGRCVERWLQAKGSCPMCRRQVVKMPTVAATPADYQVLAEVYGQDLVASTFGGVAA